MKSLKESYDYLLIDTLERGILDLKCLDGCNLRVSLKWGKNALRYLKKANSYRRVEERALSGSQAKHWETVLAKSISILTLVVDHLSSSMDIEEEGNEYVFAMINEFIGSVSEALYEEELIDIKLRKGTQDLSLEEVAPEFNLEETLNDIEKMKSEMDLSGLKKGEKNARLQ